MINPLIDVKRMDIKTQNYTMSAIHDEGNKEGDDAIRVLTSDGLEVVMDMTVLYKVVASEAPDILKSTGIDYTDKIVRPLTRTMIRDNAVYYDAVSLYSNKRDEFQNRIFKEALRRILKKGDFCLRTTPDPQHHPARSGANQHRKKNLCRTGCQKNAICFAEGKTGGRTQAGRSARYLRLSADHQ